MKIYLFLKDKILTFSIPKTPFGNYSFDENKNEESKLINIKAKDDKWFFFSTEDSKLKNDLEEELINDKVYTISRLGEDYKVYVFDTTMVQTIPISFKTGDITVGKSGNIVSDSAEFKLSKNEKYTITKEYGDIYINKEILKSTGQMLNIGDVITILGLKIIVSKNALILSSPRKINISENPNFVKIDLNNMQQSKNVNIKDKDLYKESDYFSKSPRIRRVIETKKITLSDPPGRQDKDDTPLLLTIGPMLTMGLISVVMIFSSIQGVVRGQNTLGDAMPSIIMSGAMLVSMLLWPTLTRKFTEKRRIAKNNEIKEKYSKYLEVKDKELEQEARLQKEILLENLISLQECLEMIKSKRFPFWNKRIDQSDFLTVRIGTGHSKLDIEIDDPKDGFTIEEDDLKKAADKLREKYKYIVNVPISYSFFDTKITAIMGEKSKRNTFMNNCILQITSFYSYEDLKIVILTDNENMYFDYMKYMPHSFSNEKDFRYFANDLNSAKIVLEKLEYEVNYRAENQVDNPKPHYLIITDIYNKIKRYDLIKDISENENNLGFSVVILDNSLSNLPSKCSNFITIGDNTSGLLLNAFEKQENIPFADEVDYSINMMEVAKVAANIPIEFEEGLKSLPESISFLEMEKVGNVEQLNVLNRWETSDSTQSLAAEVGVNENEDLIYLDLHEKAHGPHGLIAGMTGSGKSEFIITYILSLAVNFGPDDVSFIIIDYKGGGLAGAFENKLTGVMLPHLAGTITNLDKAEMNRSLVSINSELKRRQAIFNKARDELNESTMDIYKYQSFYKQGRLEEAVPHLFIISDEFAELKTQEPEFMDSLISAARIGRSLGVHLILATQKPSGVVNDQIWSNTKFRVCLKVQDESDSREVLKRPEAASLKETGRFYLQVGFDEYFTLGQSAWCGAKYFPTDKIIKTVDKSVNFINNFGEFIKSLQGSSGKSIKNEGEELSNILLSIIEASKKVDIKAKKLWLPNIDEFITTTYLQNKYSLGENSNLDVIIGEYDAPKMQSQNVLIHNFLNEGNTLIYGQNLQEREKLLSTILFESIKKFTEEEINFYMIDYGSSLLSMYKDSAQVGDIILPGDDEKFYNLFKFLKDEINKRKEILSNSHTDFEGFIKSGNVMPLIVVYINNFDSVYDLNNEIYDLLPEIVRDSKRYGLIFMLSATGTNSISSRLTQNFTKIYAFKLKDASDYTSLFNKKVSIIPKDYIGRGIMMKNGEIYEFQTSSISRENDYEVVREIIDNQVKSSKAKGVPILPKQITYDMMKNYITDLKHIPVGLSKKDLEVSYLDFSSSPGIIVTSNKLENTQVCIKSLIVNFKSLKDIVLIVLDKDNALALNKEVFPNYFNDNFEQVFNNLKELIKSNQKAVIVMYNMTKILNSVDKALFTEVMTGIKQSDNVFILVSDAHSKLKALAFESFFQGTFSLSDGVFIGKGVQDQNLLKISNINKEMLKDYKNDFGFCISENYATLIKIIDYVGGDNSEE